MAKRIKRYIAYVDALLERDDIDVKKRWTDILCR